MGVSGAFARAPANAHSTPLPFRCSLRSTEGMRAERIWNHDRQSNPHDTPDKLANSELRPITLGLSKAFAMLSHDRVG